MSEPDGLVCERRGAVLVARINRPAARNALDPAALAGIGAAVMVAERDPVIRAMVLTGTGDKAFSAGMDLRAFATGEAFGTGDPAATEAFYRFGSPWASPSSWPSPASPSTRRVRTGSDS